MMPEKACPPEKAYPEGRKGAGETVVFAPFKKIPDDLSNPAESWFFKNREIDVVTTSTHVDESTAILGKLTAFSDVLYIYGHCGRGFPGLADRRTADATVASAEEIAEFLKGKLPRNFAGTIKIFACKSGVGHEGRSPFAQKLADSMGILWPFCHRYVGYEKAIYDPPTESNGGFGRPELMHNWVDVGIDPHTKKPFRNARARDVQRLFHPQK